MKKILMVIMLISLFGFVGCGKDDGDNGIPVAKTYSQEEMYTKFKKAYTNRKLYSSNYTEKITNVMSDGSSNEMATISEVSANAETQQGYVKARSYTKEGSIINDLVNVEMYIVKKNNQYLNYYFNNADDEYRDVFILEDDLDDELEVGLTEEYITLKNPNQYTTIEKYATSLAKVIDAEEDGTLSVKESSFYQIESQYIFIMSFGYEEVPNYKIDVSITFDDQTVAEYRFSMENKLYGPSNELLMMIKETVEYSKTFDSSKMKQDFSEFSGLVPGKEIEVTYKIRESFVTITSNVPAKKGQKINERMSSIVDHYAGNDDSALDGWYYDSDFTNKVGDNDVFNGDTTIYAKVILKEYEINSSISGNGNISVDTSGVRGETINVGAVANSGYVVSEMYYIEEGETEKHYFVDSFTMPASDVTVYVNFGTKYRISTKEQLLAYLPDNTSEDFVLCADIDLEGMEWEVIPYFNGTFDGSGYKIHNFKMTEETIAAGLFGIVENATIKNLEVRDFDIHYISDEDMIVAGGIAGLVVSSEISDCVVEGTINIINTTGDAYAGGIAGTVNALSLSGQTLEHSIVKNSIANVTVSVQGYTSSIGGGLTAGVSEATIINNYSMGNVTVSGGRDGIFAGGLIGATNQGNILIESNYSTGNILCKNKTDDEFSSSAGGLIGMADVGTLKNNYATGNITVSEVRGIIVVGGVVGFTDEATTLIDNYRYSNQVFNGVPSLYINNEGTSGSLSSIWLFVYNKWDSNIWNLSVSEHPTLK